ncbi:hypothetical protein GCM10025876_30680 [Demequina litorisediminis]|uniref:ATP-dependent Clp protease proteolytic subunit n=1 Tax=Demequina litorisediminis TaxID=1849022 RepID=A0ABQ6IG63_9MICO|nr:hypothetical protein GCM10025876_30680 [Demequina litorisediminis]
MNDITARADGPGMGLSDSIFNRLLRERIIWLGDEVRDDNANAICAQMMLLAAEDPDKDIYLYINSPGGSITAGMAIYDTMQYIKPDVATVAMGMAASMGQFLLSSGAKGKRFATPHARVMMHQPSGGIYGTTTDIRINAEPHHAHEEDAREPHRGADREDARADQQGRRPRPVVHGRRGARVRVRRQGHHSRRRDRRRVAGRQGMSEIYQAIQAGGRTAGFGGAAPTGPASRYILPSFEERTAYGFKRQDPYAKPIRGPHHLPRCADR